MAVLPQNTTTTIGGAIISGALGSVGLSPASTRVNVSGFYKYSNRTVGPTPNFTFPDANQDWRVRIGLAPGSDYFYNDPKNTLLRPLVSEPGLGGGALNSTAGAIGSLFGLNGKSRVGVVFPYTPQLTVTHTANYAQQKLTHSNYANYFYENSEVQAITLNAEFTVQSIDEGQYLLAVIYFFRSVTKMFFGLDDRAGNPPPLVYLNGYGQYYLPNIPCVVTSFAHTMPGEVDYMDIPEPSVTATGYNPQLPPSRRLNSTRLPTTSTITLSLQPVYSRTAQSKFSLDDFARGAMVNQQNSANPNTAFGASQPRPTNYPVPKGGFL